MEIIKGTIKSAIKVVLYGVEGIGKSTFASKFPNPIFIDTEDSTKYMDVARFPRPSSWSMLLEQVIYVGGKTDYSTLVIDTADWAEQLCVEYLCSKHKKTGIEDFDYTRSLRAVILTERSFILNCYYSDYVNHMLRFFFSDQPIKGGINVLNHSAVKRTLDDVPQEFIFPLRHLYSTYSYVSTDSVSTVAAAHNMSNQELWAIIRSVSKLIAEKRGLI